MAVPDLSSVQMFKGYTYPHRFLIYLYIKKILSLIIALIRKAFMHTVLALIGKLVISVVLCKHLHISSKRMLTILDHMS